MWYRALLEIFVTHRDVDNGTQELIPCRIEMKHPGVNWELIWSLATDSGLPSELSTFLWNMVHNLLPTRERLHMLNMPDTPSPVCNLCTMEVPDYPVHALLQCLFNQANNYVLAAIQSIVPHAEPHHLVLLHLDV